MGTLTSRRHRCQDAKSVTEMTVFPAGSAQSSGGPTSEATNLHPALPTFFPTAARGCILLSVSCAAMKKYDEEQRGSNERIDGE